MLAVEIDAVAARMTEYAVEDDADAALRSRRDERTKVLDVTEHGVDLVIVPRVVVMVALGLKDGIEIDARDAKILQIVELFHDPAQIPTKEVIGDDLLRVGILEVHGVVRPIRTDDRPLLAYDHIARTREAIREDLVHNDVLEPVRRTCALVVDRDLIGRRRCGTQRTDTSEHLRIIPVEIGAALHCDDEVVPHKTAIVRQLEPRRIKFLLSLCIPCLQGNQTLPRLILPEAHEHLMNRLICSDANAKTQSASRLCRPDDGAEINILRVVLHLIGFQHTTLSFPNGSRINAAPSLTDFISSMIPKTKRTETTDESNVLI